MSKKPIKAIAIGILVLAIVLALGFMFRGKLVQPVADYTRLPETNWFVAVPCLLMLALIVAVGYIFDGKVNK